MAREFRVIHGDLWIKDGKIAQIGGRAHGFAKKVIDADGLIVAPGFVDLHTHYDAQIRWDPCCTISGWHGVTSRRARQLRLRLRAGQAGRSRALDADDDAHRSDSIRVDAGGHDVGLGDHPAVPRLARACAQGHQLHPVHADRIADDLRDGTRSCQDAARDRSRARRDAPPAERRHGRRAVRILDPASRRSIRRRPTTTARRW